MKLLRGAIVVVPVKKNLSSLINQVDITTNEEIEDYSRLAKERISKDYTCRP